MIYFKNEIMTTLLRDDSVRRDYDILTLQKLWENIYQNIIYNSIKAEFNLIYSVNLKELRACTAVFIFRRLNQIVIYSLALNHSDVIIICINIAVQD